MDKIYCVYCGMENKKPNEKCCKCNKKLNPKENLVVDYLLDHVKGDLEGNFEENIIELIINFIKNHLYGAIMTMSIIITGTALISNSMNSTINYDLVSAPPVSITDYIGEGLEPTDLLKLYIDLLKNGRDDLASSLHLYSVEGYERTLESFPLYRGKDAFMEIHNENLDYSFSNDILDENNAIGNLKFSYCGKRQCDAKDKTVNFNIEFAFYKNDNNWHIISENIFYGPYDLKIDPNIDLKGALDLIK